ncbi:trans-cinnamate 4-monooxygenase [Tanacetum coccineum]|uniref:Trans-cinnamate 4-monooxygenase n=1 Tax=Tanacetum coccineum TaxID=301880 RepID=A0ABQ5GMP2_9ASTR
MEWGIAELVNHPEIQAKLRHELDTKLGPGVQITEPDVQNLPYLQAVIKETLRLRMAAPFLVPHMNLHDAKLSGFDIPAKSRILVNTWWLANNPEQWKKPEEFRPEWFLEEEAKVETSGNDFRYLPFGFGRRSCPGMILALPIMGITLGRLVQNFELLPPPGQSTIDTSANDFNPKYSADDKSSEHDAFGGNLFSDKVSFGQQEEKLSPKIQYQESVSTGTRLATLPYVSSTLNQSNYSSSANGSPINV